ncbi:MAG TPA: hypothetical protein VLF62_03175 [Candidatus Saccharimonadales bacterium]|nr:hypothetical protein [Candidatus Saccharimonadales bacterium]
MMVDITVRPETGTGFQFTQTGTEPEPQIGANPNVRYNVESVAPYIAAAFADTVRSHAENQQATANGVNYTVKEEYGLNTIFSWVAPEDRTPDDKGRAFVGAVFFGDKGQDGQNHTVLSYSLFDTEKGPAVESQVGVYTVGVQSDYLAGLTGLEAPSMWYEPHSYDPNFAGYDLQHQPVTNDEIAQVLEVASPSADMGALDAVTGGPAFGGDTAAYEIDAGPTDTASSADISVGETGGPAGAGAGSTGAVT